MKNSRPHECTKVKNCGSGICGSVKNVYVFNDDKNSVTMHQGQIDNRKSYRNIDEGPIRFDVIRSVNLK